MGRYFGHSLAILLFLFSILFPTALNAQYDYCGSYSHECQVGSIAQCPQYCSPQQDLSQCPVNYVVCVQTSNPNLTPSIVEQLCMIYYQIRETLYALSLLLFILGGTLYLFSHFLPSAQKASYAGYALGMVLGAITIAIIAVAAPLVLSLISGKGVGAFLTTC